MGNEQIVGIVIMFVCCWGSAAIFYGIGTWAAKTEKTVHFWAGAKLDPKSISDIPAYNRENAVMWKWYSVPFWLAGLFCIFDFVSHVFLIVSVVLLFLACFPGLWILIRHYRKIEKTYIIR